MFSIGKLSEKSGIKIPTIRYYEEIELLPTPQRSQSGRRVYEDKDVQRALFIKHARSLGFEVADIRSLMTLLKNPNQSCQNADQIAQKHLAQINNHITALEALREEIEAMIQKCPQQDAEHCQIIKTLSDHSHCLHETHKPVK